MVTSSSSKLSVIGSVSDDIIKTNDDWILKRNLCLVMMKSEPVSTRSPASAGIADRYVVRVYLVH
jgi:hypothetical protein